MTPLPPPSNSAAPRDLPAKPGLGNRPTPRAAVDDPRPPAVPPPAEGRRGFFHEALAALAVPLIDSVDQRFNLGLADIRDHVRPPGAIPESLFLETCQRSGYCVEACPVKAIVPLPMHHAGPRQTGTPVILAEHQPCTLCYDLACLAACPTGAILPVPRESIRIATALWDAASCLRTAAPDRPALDCRACATACPLHERVITIAELTTPSLDAAPPTALRPSPPAVTINPDTCTGCGVCVFVCPAQPNALRLEAL